MKNHNPCFIISHKYYRGYESFVSLYVENILKNYKNPLIILVDNNSKYKEDIFRQFENSTNVILLENNIECKFEIGAYKVGIEYILTNNLLNEYEYYFFTQDNFILNNKVDIDSLLQNNTTACPINSYFFDGECKNVWEPLLNSLGLNNNLDKIDFCWCSSFMIHRTKITQIFEWFKPIIINNRWQSSASERYLARMLWELNNYRNTSIDGDCRELKNKFYDPWDVNPRDPINSFFIKVLQQKNENTVDRE